MYRVFLTLLVGLMLLASGGAHALSLNCERATERHDAFSTQQAFESWFPKNLRPTAEDQVLAVSDRQVRFQINGVIYDLTPSNWMLGKIPEKGNYKSVTGVRYKCDASSFEVIAANQNAKKSSGENTALTTLYVLPNRYGKFSEINYKIGDKRGRSVLAYWEGNNKAEGVFKLNGQLCLATVRLNSIVPTLSRFDLKCPNGYAVSGNYIPKSNATGATGSGRDAAGRLVTFKLSGLGSANSEDFYIRCGNLCKSPPTQHASSQSGSIQTATAKDVGSTLVRFPLATDNAICSFATFEGNWEPSEAHQPYVVEAQRRGLTCGVHNEQSHSIVDNHWRPSEFEELLCKLELTATRNYSEEDVVSWLPRHSFHILAYDKTYSLYGEGSYEKRDEIETIEYAEEDDEGSWVTRFRVNTKSLDVIATLDFDNFDDIKDIEGTCVRSKVSDGYIGWTWREYYDEQGSSIDHLKITAVLPNSPVEAKGVRVGDKVISIDGTPVKNSNELNDLLRISYWQAPPFKKEARIVIERNGKQREVSISREGVQTFENEFLAHEEFYKSDSGFGIRVVDVTPTVRKHLNLTKEGGVVLTDILPFGPARLAGLMVGDQILEVSGTPITDYSDLESFDLKNNEVYFVSFLRDGKKIILPVPAAERALMLASRQGAAVYNLALYDKQNAEILAIEERAFQLEQELATLKAEKEQQQATFEADNQVPLIDIFSVNTTGKQGLIKGYVADNTGVAEVTVDGNVVPVTSIGSFEYRTFVPPNGISVQIHATDLAGLTSVMSVSLERSASTATASITFDRLNPLGKQVVANRDALALIVGVADYENTPAKAVFADSDALMFRDYASEKLGIPENRIKTLVDDGADERQLLLSVKNWLSRAVKQQRSDVYVFFAGHGLASDDGEKMYLLPYDGAPELLEKTAILRDELFADIASVNPRSVTVFLDTCYSGTTRGPDMLIASRPIAIRAKESAIPDGFTVMTAAAGDQTAKPLEEAKHGMFSYFLMKGMEGDADINQDHQITAGELHAYVQQNVIQQSSGSQTPELQGDADRVLVRFQ